MMEYNGEHTLEEIAGKLGVTRERVRQIEQQALKKLKHPKFRKKWQDILETAAGISKKAERI
jgi:DNA-directed RNA polymerase sigma subunit (sigma70/sigma32)